MMHPTDCQVRVTTHARQIARVNATAWMRPGRTSTTHISIRARLGAVLIALGTRLAPAPMGEVPVPVLADSNLG